MNIVRIAFSFRFLALCAMCALASMALPGAAKAEWRLCNDSSFVVEAAVGYQDGGNVWTEGWVRIRPGGCTTAIERELIPGEHYLYARSSSAHQGGRREWANDIELCVDDVEENFLFSNGVQCESVGASTRSFAAITVDASTWRTRFVEPREPTPGRRITSENARAGGIQRLLSDAGYYDASRIDGIPGRRTENAVREFLNEIGRTRRPGDNELIDLLERQAKTNAERRGLTVCNRLSDDVEAGESIWAAIAARRDSAWESRGWWRLAPTECATLANEEVNGSDYYLYAGILEEEGERILKSGEETFCLARGRFAIVGRTRCEERGYSEGKFVSVQSEGSATVIDLTSEQFSDTVVFQD